MIRRNGAQKWKNIHITKETLLADLIDVDNSVAGGPQPNGFELLRRAAQDIEALVQEARHKGKRIRAIGSGWALTDIAITDGWLINTKLLNGIFDVADKYFEAGYASAKRPDLIVAQCGTSIAELNRYLEADGSANRRALKTAGIGAGQTIAGAISGNTHGSAINFGAMPDFVVGLQIVNGRGKSLWLERASEPVLNDEFMAAIEADRIRDDDVFNAAIVNLGAFGVVTAVALETDPLYQLKFPRVNDISHSDLKLKLNNFNFNDPPALHHYEFVYDPYSKSQMAMETWAARVPFEPGHPAPRPVWIPRTTKGLALGDKTASLFFTLPLISPGAKTAFQFGQYRKRCILGDVRATPGQLFTATITYLEGYTEAALGISINDAAKMIDISSDVIRKLKLPAMSQVRAVNASRALLGFTYLAPKTCVFEYGLANDGKFKVFEDTLVRELNAAGVRYTFHWSKNSGLDAQRVREMYGDNRVERWKQARSKVFGGDAALMSVFHNDHLARTGLA